MDSSQFLACPSWKGMELQREENHREYREHMKLFHHLSHKGNWCLGPWGALKRCEQEGLCCVLPLGEN